MGNHAPDLSFFIFLPLFTLPLCAQDDALVGTWETSFTDSPERLDGTIRVSFGADGSSQLDQVISVPDSFMVAYALEPRRHPFLAPMP